jgi:hypothetical protein
MAEYTYLDDGNDDGVVIARTSAHKVGFFGATPVAQITASSFATSAVGTASSADVTTGQKAMLIAIANTLSTYGFWPAQP